MELTLHKYTGCGHSCGSRDMSLGLETCFSNSWSWSLVVFGHKISISVWRWTSVGSCRHKALFTNLCCVLIVESLHGDHW